MTKFAFNGEEVSEERFMELLNESQDAMIEAEQRVRNEYDVSHQTASAICYLRTRSRWTWEKEIELINRDRAGNPIPLMSVLSGDF